MILCSRNKQNHKNKREKGILNMNFAFDFKGRGGRCKGRIAK
jgi:hypothetical protein